MFQSITLSMLLCQTMTIDLFLRDIEMKLICQQAEINLLFMMAYLPPGLFDRLRVRCCAHGPDYCNWKDHVLLFVDDHRVLVRKHNYPPGAESGSSPAIYIKGRGPKEELESLWEVLLRLVQVWLVDFDCPHLFACQLSHLGHCFALYLQIKIFFHMLSSILTNFSQLLCRSELLIP